MEISYFSQMLKPWFKLLWQTVEGEMILENILSLTKILRALKKQMKPSIIYLTLEY